MNAKENTQKEILLLSIIFFILYLVINFLTPLNGDDYGYAYNFKDLSTKIETLSDVFESQYVHYLTVNGRFVPHVLEQIFMGILGKTLFNILNSLLCVAFLHLIVQLIIRSDKYDTKAYIVILFLTFISSLYLFAIPGQTMFWMDGAFNYLWPSFLSLLVLKLFIAQKEFNKIYCFLLSLGAAWCQEGISVPFCVCLWLCLIFNSNYRDSRHVVLIIGYSLGTFLLVISPGFLIRLSKGEVAVSGDIIYLFVSKILNTIQLLKGLYICQISLILVFITYFRDKSIIAHNFVICLLFLVSLAFLFALGFPEERVAFFMTVISYIFSFRLLLSMKSSYVFIQRCSFLFFPLIFIVTILYYNVFMVCYDYKSWLNDIVCSIKQTDNKKVIIRKNKYPNKSNFVFIENLTSNKDARSNRILAKFYNKTSVQLIDEKLYDNIFFTDFSINVDTIFKSVINSKYCLFHNKSKNLFYIEVPKSFSNKQFEIEAKVQSNNSNLSSRQIWIRSILKTLESNHIKLYHFMIDKNDKTYCFIPNLNSDIFNIRIYLKDEDILLSELLPITKYQ